MHAVAEFEKVSRSVFEESCLSCFPGTDAAEIRAAYEEVRIPCRATKGSAGYDFFSPFAVTLSPGQSVTIPTGIRAKVREDWVLMIFPRSGLGFKYRMQLNNTVGVIDSDYYYSDNEGHIMIRLTNDTHDGRELSLRAGDRFVQGIFLPYGVTLSDRAENTRNGGFGSTG